MKLTKKLEAEILNVYNEAWEAYLKGDLKTHGFHLSNNFKIIGSSEAEQFNSKQSWLAYCKKTIKQFAGVVQLKNRKIKLVPAGEEVMVVENADIYVLIDKKWSFYSRIRITALLQKEKTGWKYIHQHGSLPDARANEGEVIATAQIKKENLLLKEAVKRRTAELEAKRRELEIEASLERVRTVAMSMNKPEDLVRICESLFTELRNLGLPELRNTMINVYDDTNASFQNHDFSGEAGPSTTYFKNNSHPVIENFIKQVRKTRDAFAPFSLSGQKLKDFIKFRERNGEKTDLKLKKTKAIHYYFYSIGNGSMGISSLSPINHSHVEILKRFRNVFDLAYKRYTDITLAEAQAREAQIELSLERVRARTMAMQHSEELAEVSSLLFEQTKSLGVNAYSSGFTIWDNEKSDLISWMCNADGSMNPPFRMPVAGDAWHIRQYESWKKGEDFILKDLSGDFMQSHFQYLRSFPLLDEAFRKSIAAGHPMPQRQIHHVANFSHGNLLFITLEPCPEAHDVFKRFAKVFEQTYTRFLDLQKAEAQAREAQIEAAVERVRAQSMAMHRTVDLNKVTQELLNQLNKLNVDGLTGTSIYLVDANDIVTVWDMSSPGSISDPGSYSFTYDAKKYPILGGWVEIWRTSNEDYFVLDFPKESLVKAVGEMKEIFPEMAVLFQNAIDSGMLTHQWSPVARLSKGILAVDLTNPPADDTKTIVTKMASAFNQAYQRFLDLQKAEAQAREAQIEAALERVRAQTMAMHNSEDMGKCILKMFAELTALGVDEGTRFGIGILNHDNENNQLWTAKKDGEEVKMHIGNLDMTSHPLLKSARKAWKAQVPSHLYVLEGEDLLQYYQMLNTAPDYKIQIPLENLPEKEIQYCFIFEHGFFYAFTPHEFQPNLLNIIQRFSSLFAQTYRRYLDLVRAEGQARESQIQLALERVRARTMAMQGSEELKEVIAIIYAQLTNLGLVLYDANIAIKDTDSKTITFWGSGLGGVDVPPKFSVSYAKNKILKKMFFDWSQELGYNEYILAGQEFKEYWQLLLTESDLKNAPKEYIDAGMAVGEVYLTHIPFNLGWLEVAGDHSLTSENIEILKRFGSVVGLTYQRFYDIRKAEGQARESQIQLALERVRARTMAMQSSEELAEVSFQLNKQVVELGIPTRGCAFNIYGENESTEWFSNLDGTLPAYKTPRENIFLKYYEAGQHGETLLVEEFGKDRIKQHYEYLHSLHLLGHDDDVVEKIRNAMPDFQIDHVAYFKYGYLLFITLAPAPEAHDVFKRFAKEFEQTYTRFLDLQKAEEQAREAQIETALERVRSRSMAMQKSEELKEVIQIVYNQLTQLKIPVEHTGFILDYKNRNDFNSWIADHLGSPSNITIPYFDAIYYNRFNEAKEKGHDFFAVNLDLKEKNKFYRDLFNHLPDFPEVSKEFVFQQPALTISTVLLDNVSLYIENFSGIPYTNEENAILMRFGKVFQQTYTRFLDLQKAEAQAREAQIEAALERVRSRSLAMHKSEELREVIQLVFEQLRQLNFNIDSAQFDLNYKESDDLHVWTAIPGQPYPTQQYIPYINNPIMDSVKDAKENGLTFFSHVTSHEEKNEFFQHFFNHVRNVPEDRKKYIFESPGYARSVVFLDNLFLGIQNYSGIPYSVIENAVLRRFGKVFEQAYTRFLDLQKAEAQAREAQIQLALERVRARAMAMQNSDELKELIGTVFTELTKLDLALTRCIIWVFEPATNAARWWMANSEEPSNPMSFYIKYHEHPAYLTFVREWKKQNVKFVYDLNGADKISWDNILFNETELTQLPAIVKNGMQAPERVLLSASFNNFGGINVASLEPLSDEHFDLLLRFAKVFDLTYTRFNDLQKAEAQAREAEIQLALERVRARSLAMHHTSELQDVVNIAAQQLHGIGMDINGGVFIAINSEVDSELSIWASGGMADYVSKVNVPPLTKPIFTNLLNAIKTGNQFLIETYSDNEKREMFTHLFKYDPWSNLSQERKQELMAREGGFTRSIIISQYTTISITNHHGKPFSEAENNILKRFGNVFEQSYIRFLDLQKAEAQAREAQIEAALERVRSCAMAMHSSKELNEVVHELRKQMGILGQKNLETCVIHLYDELPDYIQSWAAIKPPAEEGEILESIANVPKKGLMIIEEALGNYQANKGDYVIINQEEKLKQWFSFLEKESPDGFTKLAESVKGNVKELRAYWSFADFSGGSLLMVTRDEPDEPTRALLRRFSNVFGLAYRRFADLKHAEAQTREAQIEASLERVRSKTMAMHSSREVGESVATLFDELSTMKLLSSTDRCGIGIMQPNEIMELWTAEKTEGGKTELTIGFLDMKPHPLLRSAYNGWVEKKEVNQYILEGEDKLLYYQAMQNQTQYKIKKDYYSGSEKIVHTDFYFNEGVLYVFSQNEFNEESVAVFIRFANVFGQTYRRYLDLKKAEAQAREAQIEAALEKVRSRTMAMQSSEELADAAYVLFEQLNILGVTHERINIGIVNEQNQTIDFWVTEQGGEKLNTKFSGRISEPTTLSKTYQAWKKGEKSLMVDLKGEDLKSWLKYMNEEIKIPFNNAYLHDRRVQTAGFFSKGMLVVTSPEPLQEEALYLLEKFAGVFDLTYTRFSDLKIAEAHAIQAEKDLIAIKEAKQKAEIALTELQATQKQLIQAEKMASLGELTAGIAHEIQNPLNFVNNFSEVSNELIDEMNIELEKGDIDEARAIAKDVKQNLEKINHHGKRADAIVKGMLQHSRSSSGQKELTDINALCDEYLRLSYHGLRAKDKSFNAKFEIHLDPTLPKINLVPQDIGRVILNLINNAFYAVNEKMKGETSNVKAESSHVSPLTSPYESIVTVSTKNLGDKIEIRVSDNGPGIPDSIKEKIFQPFFTTKPTGQGTGLGLSLSYDIVKAHQGELKVQTKENIGTEFYIILPL